MKFLATLSLVTVLLVGIVLFGWLVWPTRYRYDRLRLSAGMELPVRINRFSGRAEVLIINRGWVLQPVPETLPASATKPVGKESGAQSSGLRPGEAEEPLPDFIPDKTKPARPAPVRPPPPPGYFDVEARAKQQPWQDKKNWRQLHNGMTEGDVRSLLGEPGRVENEGNSEDWYYPDVQGRMPSLGSDPGTLWFFDGKLGQWNEP
jgi:hypothetical protein